MPFEHRDREEIWLHARWNQRSDIGIWTVLNVVGMKTDVQKAEGRILHVREDVPRAAPVPRQLREYRD
jgi:hypothetical protein